MGKGGDIQLDTILVINGFTVRLPSHPRVIILKMGKVHIKILVTINKATDEKTVRDDYIQVSWFTVRTLQLNYNFNPVPTTYWLCLSTLLSVTVELDGDNMYIIVF